MHFERIPLLARFQIGRIGIGSACRKLRAIGRNRFGRLSRCFDGSLLFGTISSALSIGLAGLSAELSTLDPGS